MIKLDPSKEANEARRSLVRIVVTYIAAAYVFGGSTLLIGALWIDQLNDAKLNIAKDIFMMVLPVATGVITYWFASRKPSETNQEENEETPGEQDPEAAVDKLKTDTEDDGVINNQQIDDMDSTQTSEVQNKN